MTAFHLLTSGNSTASSSPFTMILLMVAMFAIMYFVMIRPQKKQQKKEQEMRDSLQVGDEITTIGGIMGRLLKPAQTAIRCVSRAGPCRPITPRMRSLPLSARPHRLRRRRSVQSVPPRKAAKNAAAERKIWTRFLPQKRKRLHRRRKTKNKFGISLNFPSYSLSENVRGIFYEQREKEKCI